MIHILARTEQDNTRFHHTTHNSMKFKTYELLSTTKLIVMPELLEIIYSKDVCKKKCWRVSQLWNRGKKSFWIKFRVWLFRWCALWPSLVTFEQIKQIWTTGRVKLIIRQNINTSRQSLYYIPIKLLFPAHLNTYQDLTYFSLLYLSL